MSINKHNIDSDDIDRDPPKPSQGNAMPSGTGTHARNAHEAEAELKDNKTKGAEGRKAGFDKSYIQG